MYFGILVWTVFHSYVFIIDNNCLILNQTIWVSSLFFERTRRLLPKVTTYLWFCQNSYNVYYLVLMYLNRTLGSKIFILLKENPWRFKWIQEESSVNILEFFFLEYRSVGDGGMSNNSRVKRIYERKPICDETGVGAGQWIFVNVCFTERQLCPCGYNRQTCRWHFVVYL